MSNTMPTITPEKTRKTSETEREPDKIIGAKLDEKTGDILLLVKWKDSFDADLGKMGYNFYEIKDFIYLNCFVFL